MKGSRDPLLEFWNPLISPDRLKLETSNLAQIWKEESANEKNAKLGQRGHMGVTLPTFGILGPLISQGRIKLGTSYLAQRWMAVSTDK